MSYRQNPITVALGLLSEPWRPSSWGLCVILLSLVYVGPTATGGLQPQALDNFSNINISACIPEMQLLWQLSATLNIRLQQKGGETRFWCWLRCYYLPSPGASPVK